MTVSDAFIYFCLVIAAIFVIAFFSLCLWTALVEIAHWRHRRGRRGYIDPFRRG